MQKPLNAIYKFSSKMTIFMKLVNKLDKNDHFRRKFQMALRGFCIWTLHIFFQKH